MITYECSPISHRPLLSRKLYMAWSSSMFLWGKGLIMYDLRGKASSAMRWYGRIVSEFGSAAGGGILSVSSCKLLHLKHAHWFLCPRKWTWRKISRKCNGNFSGIDNSMVSLTDNGQASIFFNMQGSQLVWDCIQSTNRKKTKSCLFESEVTHRH